MSKDPQYTQCVACKENLHYKPIESWHGGYNHDVAYCPNEDCVRYGLVTLEADELLADKVHGYKEKEKY